MAKWRKRTSTQDAVMGPARASTALSPAEEAIAMAFRQHTQLPLDDCLYAMRATIPRFTRSALHQLFQCHGISRLPLSADGKSAPRKNFKAYLIGHLHVDFAEGHTEQGCVYLFVAIDRTSKEAFAELQLRATKMLAAEFVRRVLAALLIKQPAFGQVPIGIKEPRLVVRVVSSHRDIFVVIGRKGMKKPPSRCQEAVFAM